MFLCLSLSPSLSFSLTGDEVLVRQREVQALAVDAERVRLKLDNIQLQREVELVAGRLQRSEEEKRKLKERAETLER